MFLDITWGNFLANAHAKLWMFFLAKRAQKTQPLPLLILFKLHFGSYSCSKKTPETSRLPQIFGCWQLTCGWRCQLCVRQWTLETTVAGASETLTRSWRGWDFPKKSGPKQGFWGARCRPRGCRDEMCHLFFPIWKYRFCEKTPKWRMCVSLWCSPDF